MLERESNDNHLSGDIELTQNEEFYKALFLNNPSPTVLVGKNASIVLVNNAFCSLSGYSEIELIGTNWTDKMPTSDVEKLKENNRLRNKNSSLAPSSYEASYYKKDGELRHCLITVNYVDSISKTIVSIIDITERKEMEKTLAENVYFFKNSQQAGNIGSYKADFKTGIWNSSEVLDQIFGIDKNYKRTIAPGWINIIHPDDREYILEYLHHEILEKQNSFNKEYRIIRKSDGEIRWVNGLGKIITDENGNSLSLIGTIQDITDRKLAEQTINDNQAKLAIALNIAHLGLWELDVIKNEFHFNDSFYAIFRTSSEKMNGNILSPEKYAKQFLHPDDLDLVASEIKKALETKDPNYTRQIEHRMIYADGDEGYLTVRFTIVKDERGRTIKLFGINQDITTTKQAQEKLKASEAQLRELNSTKDKFFSIIAHDLKSPFNSILGFSNLLVERAQELNLTNIEKYATSILNSSTSAMDLLSNLMEWSRSETGRIEFKPNQININKLVYESQLLFTETAKQKDITINIDANSDLVIFADSAMLSTVLRNLISNAIKFSYPLGNILISVKNENNKVIFRIADNGVGISQNKINKLFRINENFSTEGTQNEQGTGLGLILCKEFVERHEGEIWVESEEGTGSAFYFSIPNIENLL